MRRTLGALGAGLLFGVGLLVSGMVDPRNVVGFLDFAGHWNPNLAAVMAGAIAVHATGLQLGRRRLPYVLDRGPWFDARLVGGAAIFGVGWGLAGYCPGPGIVALGFGTFQGWAFVGAMIVGVRLGESAARWGVSETAEAPGMSAC
jgi:uncharacterized membrane protein YedE/YeeE